MIELLTKMSYIYNVPCTRGFNYRMQNRVASSSMLQHYTMSPTCKLNGVYIASASRCLICTCAEVLVLGSQMNSSPVTGKWMTIIPSSNINNVNCKFQTDIVYMPHRSLSRSCMLDVQHISHDQSSQKITICLLSECMDCTDLR